MIAFIYTLIYLNAGAANCPSSFDFTGIKEIGNDEYKNCENSIGKNLVLSGITKIGQFSFYKCIRITGKLTINSDADAFHIEQSAFQGCTGITELAFNDKVRFIDSNAFNGCSGIVSMKLPTYLIEIGNGAFYQCSEISCPIEIPFQVSKVGDFAFFNCSKITSLRKDFTSEFGKYSFSYCSSITECEIGAIKLNDGAFSYCTNLSIFDNFKDCEIKGIGVFEGCINFKENINIPSKWETVPEYTFAFCDGITGLTLHAELKSIKEKAFYYCTNLSGNLEFLYEGSSVGNEAFCGCIQLTQIRNFNRISSFDDGAFKKCTQLGINGQMNFNENLQSIPSYLFYQCSNLNSALIITDTIKNIGSFAFYECSKLTLKTDLDLSSINCIEKYTFYGCNHLNGKLILSDTISEIEEYSFYNCSQLNNLKTIKGEDLSIGEYAFYGCTSFNGQLIIYSDIKLLGNECFGLTNFERIMYYGSYEPSCTNIGTNTDIYAYTSYTTDSFCNNEVIKDIQDFNINSEVVMELTNPGTNEYDSINYDRLQKIFDLTYDENNNNNSYKLLIYYYNDGRTFEKYLDFQFNNQMKPNQFFKFERYYAPGIYVHYNGGNINIINPNEKIITDELYEFNMSLLGYGSINFDSVEPGNEDDKLQLKIHSNSTFYGEFNFNFLYDGIVESISIDDITLHSEAHILPCKYIGPNKDKKGPKLEIKKLTVEPYSDVIVESSKITGPFVINHCSKIKLVDVDLNDADIVYKMSPYYNENNIISETIKSNPNSFVIKEAEEPKRNFEKEYILIDAYFDCPNWNISIDSSAKYLDRFECVLWSGVQDNVKHYQLILFSKDGLPPIYNPDDKNNNGDKCEKSNKLSTGALIGIIIGCVVFVAVLLIAEFFIVRCLMKRRDASNNEGGNEEI